MARLSRTLGVVIAITCIVLILVFLSVKEVGRFTTHVLNGSVRTLRALPEEIAILVAFLVLTLAISCKGGESESCLSSSGLSLRSIPISHSFSALRC